MDNIVFNLMDMKSGNNTIVGMTGKGRSVIDILLKKHLLNNNYRKMHHLPLVRKGHPCYTLIKVYKKK